MKPFHEVCELIPPMSEEEYSALVDDIREHGQHEPILLHEDKIIDGRNRARACEELGITPRYEDWQRNGRSLIDFVVSMNLHRRHLNSSQKAVLANDLEPWYAQEAKARMLAGKKPDPVAPVPQGKARDQAAKAVGIGGRNVSNVKQVQQTAPELIADIRDGKLTVADASKLSKLDKRQRARVKKRVATGKAKKVSAAIREFQREETAELAKQTEPINGKYRCIVIDPPWEGADSGDDDPIGRGDPNYATMHLHDIRSLPIADLMEPDDCHFYMWVTNRMLPYAYSLLSGWSIRYITTLTWCKPSIGVGRYFRNSTEHIIFGMVGTRLLAKADVPTWFVAKRDGKHSTKPKEFYDIVEACSPGPRLEIFGRKQRKGWTVWGAEANG